MKTNNAAEVTAPDDFARLFRIEGIGQVLAVLEDGETEEGEDWIVSHRLV
ncbi:hypothetical protein [Paracoccus hibiscisoli]|nr:hypothetical protein [Paracoccus hibiscisoli]